MKVVADESVDRQIVERLRDDGHDVLYVAELDPGIEDEMVLSRSRQANAMLVTAENSPQCIEKRVNRLWRAEERLQFLRLKAAGGTRD